MYEPSAPLRYQRTSIMREDRLARLVPELLVTDLSASLKFWVDLCGFSILYQREEERFAFLDLDGAQVMLDELRGNGRWVTGPLDRPFGRGLNLEIKVAAVEPLIAGFEAGGWPLYQGLEEQWYRSNDVEIGVRQFLVQDPDGYLLRFSARIGTRPYPGR